MEKKKGSRGMSGGVDSSVAAYLLKKNRAMMSSELRCRSGRTKYTDSGRKWRMLWTECCG